MTGQPIPSKQGFNLQKDMTDETLWKELNRIGISGETTQEIVEFRKPKLYHKQYEGIPLHNGIMSNEKYAIIGKSYVFDDIFRGLNESWEYYLAGLNDEGKYFIRPIKGFNTTKRPVTIQDVVDWINRKDEGFEKRIQGDVLIKYLDLKPLKVGERNTFDTDNLIPHRAQYYEHHYQLTTTQPVNLGNHKLFCDGEIYIGMTDSEILLKAESFMLKHSEHKFVNEQIPKNQIAILAPQRGRNFDLSNYLRRAFD